MCFSLCFSIKVSAEEKFPRYFDARSRYVFESDIEATSSRVSMLESKVKVGHDTKIGGLLPFEYRLDVGHIDIYENDPLDLPNHLESRRVKLRTAFPAFFMNDEDFFAGLEVMPTLNTDSGSYESGAMRVLYRPYLIFRDSENFILVAGATIRPEYDKDFLPFIGMVYKPNDRLTFRITDEPKISCKLNETDTLVFEFDSTLDEYEVTRGAQKGVTLRYEDISAGIGLERQFHKHFKGFIGAGGVWDRHLEYDDGAGSISPEKTFYSVVNLTLQF